MRSRIDELSLMIQDGPDDPCQFVANGDNDRVEGLSIQKANDPRLELISGLLAPASYSGTVRSGAVDEDASEVTVAPH